MTSGIGILAAMAVGGIVIAALVVAVLMLARGRKPKDWDDNARP